MSFITQKQKIKAIDRNVTQQEYDNEKIKKQTFLDLTKHYHKIKHTIPLLENVLKPTNVLPYRREWRFIGFEDGMLTQIFPEFYITTLPENLLDNPNIFILTNYRYSLLWKQDGTDYLLQFSFLAYIAQKIAEDNYTILTSIPTYLNLNLITYNPLIHYELSNNKT